MQEQKDQEWTQKDQADFSKTKACRHLQVLLRSEGNNAAAACVDSCGPPFVTKDGKRKLTSQELREEGVFAGGKLAALRAIASIMFPEDAQ